MADKQISDLTAATGLTDGSLFVIEQSGAAKSANWGMVKNYISPGVAAQYSTSATYNVGDYVIYNGQLYRCTTAITTAESWTAAHWTAAVLGNDVVDLKSALNNTAMKYRGTLPSGVYTNALVGTYTVDSSEVTGLPSGMSQTYGWLTCYAPNGLYVLVESDSLKTTWVKEGSSNWVKTFPSTYHGSLSGSITNANTGTYAVSNANVTGLPSEMTQAYGWLTCYVPNQLYVLVESNTSKTTWLKEGGSDWIKVYPNGTAGDNRLQDKLIAYNGDSICESRFSGFASNGGGYPYLISQIVGGTYENKAVSGGTLAVSQESHNICTTVSSMTDNADIICFEGGINDYWDSVPLGDYSETDFTGPIDNTTVCGALESIFRQAINKWVGKPIVFIIVHKIATTAWTRNSAGYTFAEQREKMLGICEKYSIPVLDMWGSGGLNAYMSALDNAFLNGGGSVHPDGCHPDVNGYKKYYVPRLISVFESLLPYDN